jgi:hypothetical protein
MRYMGLYYRMRCISCCIGPGTATQSQKVPMQRMGTRKAGEYRR